MKVALFALVLVASVAAQARPSTTRLTCDQAAATVAQAGAIVLSTGEYTYDRFVTHSGFCAYGEVLHPAWVPTLDDAQCFIGYTCGQRTND